MFRFLGVYSDMLECGFAFAGFRKRFVDKCSILKLAS